MLLDDKAQLMGYLSVLEHRGWDRLVIQTLAIRWTVRRQGWARRMLEQVIQEGRQAGWGAIRLEVADANPEAQTLYQGLGFRPRLRLPDYYGPGLHAHRLVLPLGSGEQGAA
ncbi:ribosomal-protein-alanine N-acetyltransferase [compost metagenome]